MSVRNDLKSYGATAEQIRVLAGLAPLFWKWYDLHADDKLVTVKILFINKTIRVRDVRVLFELLFGPRPVDQPDL